MWAVLWERADGGRLGSEKPRVAPKEAETWALWRSPQCAKSSEALSTATKSVCTVNGRRCSPARTAYFRSSHIHSTEAVYMFQLELYTRSWSS